MNEYEVIVPIAGHIRFYIEADSPEEAKKKYEEGDYPSEQWDQAKDGITYECLDSFGKGNVCYCPSPWEITVSEA